MAAAGARRRAPPLLLLLTLLATYAGRTEAVVRGLRATAQRVDAAGAGSGGGGGGPARAFAETLAGAERALAARERSMEAEVGRQREALIQQQRALEGLMSEPQAPAIVVEKRLEKWVSMQKSALIQQEAAIKGLAAQQAEMDAKEGTLEKSVGSLLGERRSGGGADPPHLVADGPDGMPAAEASMTSLLIGALIHVVGTIIWAYIYGVCFTYAYPDMRNPPEAPVTDQFTFGLFHGFMCDPDWRICCCSCFCGGIRWADTMGSDKVGFLSFWPAVLLFALLQYLTGLTGVAAIALLALGVMGRQRIREAYELPHGDCQTCWQDCLIWLCCSPCAIMQEASQIELVDLPGTQANDFLKEQAFPPNTGAMPDTLIIR